MVKLHALISFLEAFAPLSLAEEYDNPGLQVEGASDEIETVLISLDTDEKVVQEAESVGAELILSHHPLLFNPVRSLGEKDPVQRTVRRLIQKGIANYAMHTNADSAKGGLCDVMLAALGLEGKTTSFSGEESGIGRVIKLANPCTIKDIAEKAKKAFGLARLSMVGEPEKKVTTLALCSGGGGSMVYDAQALGADLYISGDFKYQHARYAFETGMSLLEISHYDSEIGFCNLMQDVLQKEFGDRLSLHIAKENINPWKEI